MKSFIKDKSIFYSGLCYFLIMIAFIVMRIVFGAGLLGDVQNTSSDYLFTFIVQIGILFLIPVFCLRVFAKQPLKTIFKRTNFKGISGKMAVWSVLLGVCVFIVIIFVSSLWSGILSSFGFDSGTGVSANEVSSNGIVNLLLGILFVGVLPGFCEEFSHRGMILGNIKKDGVWRAILLASLMFALMHLNISQFGYAFVVGLVLGTITMLTKSIFPAMIVHCTSNSISTYISTASDYGWWGGDFYDVLGEWISTHSGFAVFVMSALILCAVLTLIFYIMFALFRNAKRNEFFNFKKRLKKSLKAANYDGEIDLNNNEQVFKLYQEAQFVNLQKKLLNSNLTIEQLQNNVNKTTLLSIMFDEDVTKKTNINYLDYVFYYISICLGTVVTIMTFIWGII